MKLRKNTDFLGRAGARGGAAARRSAKRLAGFTVDDPDVVLLGRETILRDGEPVGYLTSGGYGYTIGRPSASAMSATPTASSDDFLAAGDYELVVASEAHSAELVLAPLYDPAGLKIRS